MDGIRVVNRRGEYNPLDISKITDKLVRPFSGIKENSYINRDDFMISIRPYLKDGIKSTEITEMLIKSALDKVEPGSFEYDQVAAGLLVSDIEHRIYKETGLRTYGQKAHKLYVESINSDMSYNTYKGLIYEDYIHYGIDHGVLHPILKDVYSRGDFIRIGSMINVDNDLNFKYIGIKTLEDRYLKKDMNGHIFELPQWRFMTIAIFLAIKDTFKLTVVDVFNDEGGSIGYEFSYFTKLLLSDLSRLELDESMFNKVWSSSQDIMEYKYYVIEQASKYYDNLDVEARLIYAKHYYEGISEFDMMTATPTLANAGTIDHQLSSCFQQDQHDSAEGIMDALKEAALCSKYGGGIGKYLGRMRGGGSSVPVGNSKGASKDITAWTKVDNDLMNSFDQKGVRKGSKAPYLDVWHINIKEFLDLKRKGGDERARAHDLFPGICVPDLFMKILFHNDELENEQGIFEKNVWYLISPYFTKDSLIETYGDEWEENYRKFVKDPKIPKIKLNIEDLWKYILNTYYKDGNPFIFWRDNHNRPHTMRKLGTVVSSQLCTELSQVTWTDKYGIKLSFSKSYFKYEITDNLIKDDCYSHSVGDFKIEDDYIIVPQGFIVSTNYGKFDVNKVTALHRIIINGVQYELSRVDRAPIEYGQTAVCNLASLNYNMSKDKREKRAKIAIRMLDNVIDLNFYPTHRTQISAHRFRAIAIGKMNVYNYIVNTCGLEWTSQEARNELARTTSEFSKYEIEASCDLSTEKGSFKYFESSEWSKGIIPYEYNIKYLDSLVDTDVVDETMAKFTKLSYRVRLGMRNGYLQAPAPTGSISIITDCSSGVEGIYAKQWMEENSSGLIPCVAPGLNAGSWERYKSVYDYDPEDCAKNTAVIQVFQDQSISYNTYVDPTNEYKIGGIVVDLLTKLSMTFETCWRLGMKSNYYLRSKSPELKDEADKGEVMDRSLECTSCQ